MGGVMGLCHVLRTSVAGGIAADEDNNGFELRREIYGPNTYPLPPVTPFMVHVWQNLKEEMLLKVLIVAGLFSILASIIKSDSSWVEGIAILMCVCIVLFTTAFHNHKSQVEYRSLAASLKGSRVNVLRAGAVVSLDQDDLVVGDIVFLAPGSMVPADGVVADSTTISVNESALTGEPDEKPKHTLCPFLYAGTEVVDGSCAMICTSVGVNTAKGKIMTSLAQEQEPTELQKRLASAEALASIVGAACGIGTFLALFIRFCFSDPDWSQQWSEIIDFVIAAITVIMVAVPEGLPLAVTVSLAYSMAKMRDDQNLVKVLSACETMGNATGICSDKTGTLTQNRMTVVQACLGGHFFNRQPKKDEVSTSLHKLLIRGIVCNSDRRIEQDKMDFDVPAEDWQWEGDGGATEAALLSWLSRYYRPSECQTNIMQLRSENGAEMIKFYPFSSAKKFSAVVMGTPIPDPEDSNKLIVPPSARMYFKGAADRIISRCTRYVDSNGVPHPVPYADGLNLPPTPEPGSEGMCSYNMAGHMCNKYAVLGPKGGKAICCADPLHRPSDINAEDLTLLEQHPYKIMTNMTRSGLRCIAFAYIDDVPLSMKDGQLVDPDENQGGEWTLVGFVGIKDPLRLETRDAVMTVQQAGVIVRMVTGDNIDTATFIAKDCGIITSSKHLAMEGQDFRKALEQNENHKAKTGNDNPDFVEMIRNLRVMARCQPDDKLELVKFLKEHDEIIGVTGDGSNDGPALKTANIGLCMGSGTDVAKAAADIILLDDNFASLVKSVMWGRAVFDNIRKFLQFQLSVNVTALVVAILGAIITGGEPLKPIQLLYVNLIMDTVGALALGTEIPKPDLLKRNPYRPGSNLISRVMFRNIIGQAVAQLVILLPILFTGPSWFPNELKHWVWNDKTGLMVYETNEGVYNTWIFNTFVWMQLFNQINSRKVNDEVNVFLGIFDNAWFLSLFAVCAVMQVFIVELFGVFMQTKPQPTILWVVAVGLGLTQLVSGFVLRLFVCNRSEGQVVLEDDTFENAAWLNDPSLIGAMFKPKEGIVEDNLKSADNVYVGDKYLPFVDSS